MLLFKIDQKLLQTFDRMVLYIWDKFEIPKVYLYRIFVIASIFRIFESYHVVRTVLTCLIIVSIQVFLEFLYISKNPLLFLMENKTREFFRLRLFILIVNLACVPFYLALSMNLNAIDTLILAFFAYLFSAITPSEPPKKKFKKLKLAFETI